MMRFARLSENATQRQPFAMNRAPNPLFSAVWLTLALSACSTLNGAGKPGPAPATPTPQTATVSTQANGSASNAPAPQQPPFDSVIKGADRQEGLLPIWKRQDKVWIELSPEAFGKPFFLSPKLASGIGEAGVFGGLMQSRWAQVGRPQWVEFRKVQQQVQLLAINSAYTAQKGTPQARAVQAAFSPSLLGSVPLASAPHAKSGAVLIEANALLLSDLLGVAQHLQRTYRQSYGLDGRNSFLQEARSQNSALVFEVSQHFATAGIAAGPGVPGTPMSSVPLSVPDPRSMFITVHYSLSALPDKPMSTRAADPRVGYFTTTVADFTDDLARTPRQRYINRWRLEKKDPAAALSEPVRPIVFWLDPSIPDAYRPTITEGILEWNKAFEAIGFKNAIEVRTPPTDKPFDTLETGHTSIRWMTNSGPVFGAIGPTHVDPRTGEILDADIALESLSSRSIRTVRSQFISANNQTQTEPLSPDACQHGQEASEQLGLALDVLETQGVLDPDSPQVKEFVLAYIKDTTMHEVGHTLGLRHNFRASRWHTAQELTDPELTRTKGNSASVMDYAPINLPMPGQRAGAPFQTTLGPYDYWAIEYGYKALPEDAAAARKTLQDIAQRSADPAQTDALAFGTDEDNALGLDPQSLVFDLGNDPVAFARTRLAIVQDLFQRQSTRTLTPQDDVTLLRRSVSYGLRDMARTSQILLRQVGGVVTRRDAPGSGRDLLDPLPSSQQRAALDLLLSSFLSPQALNLPPALLRRLAPDYLDRQEGGDGHTGVPTDFSLAEQMLVLQRDVQGYLMSEALAERLLDNIDKTRDKDKQPLTVRELHRTLMEVVWSDKALPPGTESARRNLQRDYVNRLAATIVRSTSPRADVRAILRQQAIKLLHQLKAERGGDPNSTASAHRQDCIDTLSSALQASVVRTAP
ncbi:MAG TPA: zinc-dependent metalloprotease [Aquabacterium sp.]|uniref:zinc-dependent metalloprotease n=1 Tax=Aquabacterium sp. TaxID=1872578 RepID=UPI002E30BE15|nr:zinc-dependent metalloprotease [Aquabacterium sp.]HEX5356597.1 zinc-dependent metalloprotease [Aquabacterium sp.]